MVWDKKYDDNLHQYAGAIVAEITVFTCFLESYQRIRNPHLKWSITLFIIFSVLVNACYLTGTAFVGSANVVAAVPFFIGGSVLWVLAWICVTYHTSYRAALISLVGFQRPWLVSLAAVICQGLLSGTGSVFFTINFVTSLGTKVDPRSTLITFIESFWYSIVETALFVITQYRIVSVRSRIKKVATTIQFQLYWKAVMRSILYSLNVIMMFLAVGNTFGVNVGLNWSLFGHAITLLILMTDSNRFQETVGILNGDIKRTGTGMIDTKNFSSQNGTSGNNHSFSDHKGDYSQSKPSSRPRTKNIQPSNSVKFSSDGGDSQYSSGMVFGTGAAAGQLYPPSRAPSYSNINQQSNSAPSYGAQANGSYGYQSQANNYQASSQFGGSQNGKYGSQNGQYGSQNGYYGGSQYNAPQGPQNGRYL
ncbi:hypothetical protein BJ742DRAFT_873558 [Cladochytrium replicatum]|nr:hypothetical protein BJ742DRAFT_873558 [Cladochytrium replicatum]